MFWVQSRTATHCNTLQQTASHCNKLQHTVWNTPMQHPATPCNTLQHPATPCNRLRVPKFSVYSLRNTHCNTHFNTHCNTQSVVVRCSVLQRVAACCRSRNACYTYGCVVVCCSVLHQDFRTKAPVTHERVAVCCNVLHCAAVCCIHFVAV